MFERLLTHILVASSGLKTPMAHDEVKQSLYLWKKKKLKVLSLEEPNSKDLDILFISSVTLGDLIQLGKKCRLILSKEGADSTMQK